MEEICSIKLFESFTKRMVAKEVCNPMRLKKNGHNEYLRGV